MDLLGSSVSPATWRQYGKAWEEWLVLVHGRDVAASAQSRLEVTLDYFLQLRGNGCSGSVAARRLAGVSFYFRVLGWLDVTKDFIITQALKGWKKGTVSRERRRPVSFVLLQRLVSHCSFTCFSNTECLLFSTAFALMFFAALRVGELLPPSRAVPGGLAADQVLLGSDSVRIYISRSKTDVFGRGIWLRIGAVGGIACPVALITRYMGVRPQGVQLLLHADGSPLTKFQFQSVFKRLLVSLGCNSSEFGTHSFRIGAATEAARLGLSDDVVKRIGRWRSSRFGGYIRPALLLH